MHALFMRHGHTNYNQLGLCNDDPRTAVHLSETGIRQAQAAAQTLRSEALELIVTSELPRTRQTAEFINAFHHVPLCTHPALNDIRSGFDGRSVEEYFQATATDPLHLAVNGGESLLMHKQRVLPYLDWLRNRTEQTILSIAHEETLRVFYAWFNGIADEALRSMHFANCEVLRFEL